MTGDAILVWGAGAIGGTVGAYLTRAGHDVTFVDIVPDHVSAIRGPGLHIHGPVADFTVQAPALLPEEVSGTWDRVFLCVKAHHTAEACQALLPHLAADGYVLSLQNGLCETIIAGIAGAERTMGAFVNFGADWMGPGSILYGNRGAVVLGEINGAETPRLRRLHTLMQAFEPDTIITPDIWSYLWGKLGYGAMLFAQALGDASIADCLARPELLPTWRALGGEAVAVALAEGVQPRGFNGFDPPPSAPVQRRPRPPQASPQWSPSTGPAPRRTQACGGTLRCADAGRRWTCRSPPSSRSAPSTASHALPLPAWSHSSTRSKPGVRNLTPCCWSCSHEPAL